MRAFVMSAIIGLVVFAWSGMARAQVVERAVNAVAGTAVNAAVNADANMQFHNGRWWYWQPSGNHWMVYHDNQWFAPNSTGGYTYSDGRPLWSSTPAPRTRTGYRGSYYGNNNYGNGYNNGYYGNGYNNGYYGNGYNNGYGNRYGNGYGNSYGRGNYGYGNNRGANIGANIGGCDRRQSGRGHRCSHRRRSNN